MMKDQRIPWDQYFMMQAVLLASRSTCERLSVGATIVRDKRIIGGIDKKVIAAKRAGATIFFAPYVKPTKALLAVEEKGQTNYQLAKATAKKYAPNMKVVPVTSFKQAVHYLQTHQ